jgi:hypothetical protein
MPPAGLLARGSKPPFGLPGADWLQWQVEGRSPLTVAGAAAELGQTRTAFPFSVPHHAGTDDGRTIAAAPPRASGPWSQRIDKRATRPVKCPHIGGLSKESQQGTRYGSRPKSAAAPATVSGEPEPSATGWEPGKAAKAKTREPGDLPPMLVARRAGCLGAVGSLAVCPKAGRGRRQHPESRGVYEERRQGESHRHRRR